MPYDEAWPEWGDGEGMELSDYLITGNAFLVCLQEGIEPVRLRELWEQANDPLTFEGLCRLEVYKKMEAQNG